MADVSHGPVASMPGHVQRPGLGTMCDDHPLFTAVKRVQGETDSFGAEYIDMCQACYEAYQAHQQADAEKDSHCDWCSRIGKCRPHRDFEEGSSGRVYNVCGACRLKESESVARELAESGGLDYFYSDFADSGWSDAPLESDDDVIHPNER